jgi:hypothetical protein
MLAMGSIRVDVAGFPLALVTSEAERWARAQRFAPRAA